MMQNLYNAATNLCFQHSSEVYNCKIRTTEKSTSRAITDDLLEVSNYFLEGLSPENQDISNLLVCLKNAKYSRWHFTETIKTAFPTRNNYFNCSLSMWIHMNKKENQIKIAISLPKGSCENSGFYKISSNTTPPKELCYLPTTSNNYQFIQKVIQSIEKEYVNL